MPPFGITRAETEARLAAVESAWSPRSSIGADGIDVGRRRVDLPELGGFGVAVEVDQFLDLGPASWLGSGLSFVAPSSSRSDPAWIRRWAGGLLTTCGLDQVGPDGQGNMHGRASTIPARLERCAGYWEDDDYLLVVEGRMREAALYDANWSTVRTLRARTGVPRLELTDRFRNEGFDAQRLRILYHVNLGWPFLTDDSVVRVGADRSTEGARLELPLGPPVVGAAEIAEAIEVPRDTDGWAEVAVTGRSGLLTLRWRASALQHFTLWRSAVAGGYAVGVEPGTCWPSHIDAPDSGKEGYLVRAGEEHVVDLTITLSSAPTFD